MDVYTVILFPLSLTMATTNKAKKGSLHLFNSSHVNCFFFHNCPSLIDFHLFSIWSKTTYLNVASCILSRVKLASLTILWKNKSRRGLTSPVVHPKEVDFWSQNSNCLHSSYSSQARRPKRRAGPSFQSIFRIQPLLP